MMIKRKIFGVFLILTVILMPVLFGMTVAEAAERRFVANPIPGGADFSIDLSDGSRIYWLYSGASGMPTRFDFSGSQNLAAYRIVWPFPLVEGSVPQEREYYYSGKLSIPVYFTLQDYQVPLKLKVKLQYLLCKTQCVPVEQYIEQQLYIQDEPINSGSFVIGDIGYDGEYLSFQVRFDRAVEMPKFLACAADFDFKVSRLGDFRFEVVSRLTPRQYKNIKDAVFDIYSDMAATPAKLDLKNLRYMPPVNFALILLLALIGGFVLNFMPCVLPVLSLKLLALGKMSGCYGRHAGKFSVSHEALLVPDETLKRVQSERLSIIATIFGILASFLTLSLISINLKNAGRHFGLGLNFQYPEFIIILAVIITFFISSVLGRINIRLPAGWDDFLARYHFKNLYLEGFFSGVLATVLSTPCTAPFLGTAMSFAIAGNSMTNIAVFLTAGIGFGMPYLLLIFCPSLIKYLPKPGKWLVTFKYIMALLLLATLFWLLSILYAQAGWRPVLGLFLLLILLKFLLESDFKIFFLKLALIIAIILGGIYLPQIAYEEDLQVSIESAELWQPFDAGRIPEYTAQGKIVVVDITADWCATCKFNKFMLWDQERTVRLLRAHNVIAMRGDYTNVDENITVWLMQNQIHGIPFNVVYDPAAEGKPGTRIVLPVIVSYSELKKVLEKAARKN